MGATALQGEAARSQHRDSPEDPLLEVDDIHLEFGGVRALQGVSFGIGRGQIFSLIGPNGAGKTSMLNVISGAYRCTKGRIRFEGKDRTHARPEALARLGIARTFQHAVLFKGMTVHENMLVGRHFQMRSGLLACGFALPNARREEDAHAAAVDQILEFLEIDNIAAIEADTLPYGLQKRVELGRALVMSPKLLLLDEPMAGMNPDEKADIVRFVRAAVRQFGTTVMLIEHDMGVVMDVSDVVAVLDYGRKIAEGPPDAVRADGNVIRAYLGEDL